MQNQSSPAQLLFPTIPASFHPTGTWAEVLNSLITLYLNNGTVNLPFLNEVSPQQIQQINQNILNLQNAQNAVNYQSGTIGITSSASIQNIAITFPSAMADSTYQITGYFNVAANPTVANQVSWGVVAGTKLSTGFNVWILANNTDILSFTWQISNLAAL